MQWIQGNTNLRSACSKLIQGSHIKKPVNKRKQDLEAHKVLHLLVSYQAVRSHTTICLHLPDVTAWQMHLRISINLKA